MAPSERFVSDVSSNSSPDTSDSEFEGGEERSIVSEICGELMAKGEHLNKEIEEMQSLEGSCVKALERLHLEQAAWSAKLDKIKKKMTVIEKKKDEAALMLDLHQMLRTSGGLAEAVRAAQHVVSEGLESQTQVPLDITMDSHSGKCTICLNDISPEEMLSKLRQEKGRDYKPAQRAQLRLCGKCAPSTPTNSKSSVSDYP